MFSDELFEEFVEKKLLFLFVLPPLFEISIVLGLVENSFVDEDDEDDDEDDDVDVDDFKF
jgi:hypothetical protein